MGFRFWRRVRLAPGVTVNLSRSGASLSLGPRGAKYTFGPRGSRVTLGIPGSGLFYTVHEPHRQTTPKRRPRLSLGFFRRLITPANERRFVEGLKALHQEDLVAALRELEAAGDLPDGAWLAGMLHLKRENLGKAEHYLALALSHGEKLGALLDKYGVEAEISLPLTPEISAHVWPRERGTLLALVEIYQLQGRHEAAMDCLHRLLQIDPGDRVVLLSFAELALQQNEASETAREVIDRIGAIGNETPIETALLLYKGRALRRLGLAEAAKRVFTLALRRRKDRPSALLHQLRYERGLVYAQLGRKAQARRDWERIFAEAPEFEDVRRRLGLE